MTAKQRARDSRAVKVLTAAAAGAVFAYGLDVVTGHVVYTMAADMIEMAAAVALMVGGFFILAPKS